MATASSTQAMLAGERGAPNVTAAFLRDKMMGAPSLNFLVATVASGAPDEDEDEDEDGDGDKGAGEGEGRDDGEEEGEQEDVEEVMEESQGIGG